MTSPLDRPVIRQRLADAMVQAIQYEGNGWFHDELLNGNVLIVDSGVNLDVLWDEIKARFL